MKSIVDVLKNGWNERHKKDFYEDSRKSKILFSPSGQKLFEVEYSSKLEKFYFNKFGKERYNKPVCFFCDKNDEYHYLEQVARFKHLGIFFNIKSVGVFHFLISPWEHRELPTQDDIAALRQLSSTFSGLSILGNLKDSGAGYPIHIHYQTLFLKFLSVDFPCASFFSNEFLQVEIVEYPELIFKFSAARNNCDNVMNKVISRFPPPYNPLFYNGNIFILPRTKSVPCNTDGAKFAAAEVYGHVIARNLKMYNDMNYLKMLSALDDVCLPKLGEKAKKYKEAVLKILEENGNEI